MLLLQLPAHFLAIKITKFRDRFLVTRCQYCFGPTMDNMNVNNTQTVESIRTHSHRLAAVNSSRDASTTIATVTATNGSFGEAAAGINSPDATNVRTPSTGIHSFPEMPIAHEHQNQNRIQTQTKDVISPLSRINESNRKGIHTYSRNHFSPHSNRESTQITITYMSDHDHDHEMDHETPLPDPNVVAANNGLKRLKVGYIHANNSSSSAISREFAENDPTIVHITEFSTS